MRRPQVTARVIDVFLCSRDDAGMGHSLYKDGVTLRPLPTGALIAYLDGESEPVGVGLLVSEGRRGEIVCTVATAYLRRVGHLLSELLEADARAANLTDVTISLRPIPSMQTFLGEDGHPLVPLTRSDNATPPPRAHLDDRAYRLSPSTINSNHS